MSTLDTSKGAVPLYVQIYQKLKEKIESKEYEYGQIIPTELELQELYGVSRITVRQAIQALEQEGMVSRARGRGTVVSRREKIEELLTRIKSFTDEMKDRGMIPGTKWAEITRVEADEKLAEIFSCQPGDPLYRITRVRTADGAAIVLFDTYVPGTFPLPMEREAYYGSLYELLAKHGVPAPMEIEEQFEAIIADKETAKALDIQPGAPVMKRVRMSFDGKSNVQEYTLSYYNAARYTYVIHAVTAG